MNHIADALFYQCEKTAIGRWVFDVLGIFWSLVKIMVPILLVVRIIELLGWISILGESISPIMVWFGLPGEMGLVWVTAMSSNLYAGMAIFYQLGGAEQLTIAQVSVLCTMMLVSHGLPIEAAIAKAVGSKLRFTLVLRIGGAMLFGFLLHHSYSALDVLQTPINTLWKPDSHESNWVSWLVMQGQTFIAALIIIAILTLIIRILNYLGIEKIIHILLSPLLRLLGIGTKASNIVVIGLTLGLSFGGSILIRESKTGHIDNKDIFLTMAFLGLSHSLIEDTLLMLLMGADLFTVLWLRLTFGIIAIALLARLMNRLSEKQYAWFYRNSNSAVSRPSE
ncbi:membrane protein [Marinomonas ushuaiensis DSM 15871]|uniref:Membrane protein n=1 Tax=Marinomonas ushuaiensis DSM 15871 TaxID=1122207 RepID=X7E4R6_9GAMM|nr:membrane protein [Marinomonas ushuaiensis DSM 15871]